MLRLISSKRIPYQQPCRAPRFVVFMEIIGWYQPVRTFIDYRSHLGISVAGDYYGQDVLVSLEIMIESGTMLRQKFHLGQNQSSCMRTRGVENMLCVLRKCAVWLSLLGEEYRPGQREFYDVLHKTGFNIHCPFNWQITPTCQIHYTLRPSLLILTFQD